MNDPRQKIVKSTLFAGVVAVSMAMPFVASTLAHLQDPAHAATVSPASQHETR